MAKKVVKEEKNTVTVEVLYFKNNSARKKNEVMGVFTIEVEPREVRPVNEKLKGKKLAEDKARFVEETDKAEFAIRTDALNEVHEVVGWGPGILVANINKEEN